MLCGDPDGREVQQGRGICVHIVDSPRCAAESNATLYSNYIPKIIIIMGEKTLLSSKILKYQKIQQCENLVP